MGEEATPLAAATTPAASAGDSPQRRELTCIRCPKGCQITVTIEHGAVTDVTGNTCPRGEEYARKEVTNPTRVVTSIVPVDGSPTCAMASVKTAGDVPKDKVLDVIDALRPVRLQAPVRIGDVVLADVCETGVDVVATKDC
jgi:CxxC motif-containing protein